MQPDQLVGGVSTRIVLLFCEGGGGEKGRGVVYKVCYCPLCSLELRELEEKLRAGYVSKERAAQLYEKKAKQKEEEVSLLLLTYQDKIRGGVRKIWGGGGGGKKKILC